MNLLDKIIQASSARYYIKEQVPRAELLAQLAEEGAELTHAALKLRRVIDDTNPTPVRLTDAVDALQEEVADVLLLITLLGLNDDPDEIQEIIDFKTLRWEQRLKEKEGAADQAALARMEVMPK